MLGDLLPVELVGADVEAAPALRVGDEAGHRHRSLRHLRQRLADGHVLPVARGGAAHLLGRVEAIDLGQLLVGVAPGRPALHVRVLGALLARVVALGAEAPAIRLGEQLALLVAELHVVDLLHRAAREARLVLDQVLEPRLGRDLVVAPRRLVPRPVRARPHGVHAREPAHVARDDAARREEEARQRDDPAVARARRVGRVAPERVVVADAVGVVADVVAGGLVAPRLERVGDGHADAPAQVLEALRGDLGEELLGLGRHGSPS